jgi:hypothetical protein
MPEVRGTITCPYCDKDIRFVLMAMVPPTTGHTRATTYEAFHANANGCNVLWKCPNPRCFKRLVLGWRLLPPVPAPARSVQFVYTQSTQNNENSSVRLSPLPFQSTQSTVATKTSSVDGDEQPTQIAMTQTQTQVQQVQQAFTELDELLTKRNATTSEDDGDNDNVDGSKKQKTWGSFVNYYHQPYDHNN